MLAADSGMASLDFLFLVPNGLSTVFLLPNARRSFGVGIQRAINKVESNGGNIPRFKEIEARILPITLQSNRYVI